MSDFIENLIIGTGPTALAAAMALKRQGIPFEVLDVGYDLEPEREAAVSALSSVPPDKWRGKDTGFLFPPPSTSARGGVAKRLSFGSDFAYRTPEYLSWTASDCTIDLSHGLGGFGNVWGAAVLPYSDHDLRDWPVSSAEFAQSWKNISRFVPQSGEQDALQSIFASYHNASHSLVRSAQTKSMLGALAARDVSLRASGIQFGRARVAVDSSGGESTCRYCGRCLDGCPYGSIFNPRRIWKSPEFESVKIHKGFYALEFNESADGVAIYSVDMRDGTIKPWNARRVFVGMGAIASTRLIARSLKLQNNPIRILDSQYFFFPLLSYRKMAEDRVRFALAEVFLEILNPRISQNYVHFQVYGLNDIFRQTLESVFPRGLHQSALFNNVAKRFYLLQGFLHSSDSSYLEMTITASETTRDQIHFRGVTNPGAMRIAKAARTLLRNKLFGFGLIPPFYLAMVPPGRSFHAGASFPMGARASIFSSDRLGRPAGLKRLHVIDASVFPNIPAPTITYSAMANSDRIIGETLQQENL